MTDSLDKTDALDFMRDAVSRRTFLARMGAAGLGTAAAALIAGCGGSSSNGSGPTPGGGLTAFADQANFPGIPGATENIVVLNYALTLETLEADIYRQALNIAAGKPLTTALPADGGLSYTQAVPNGAFPNPALAPIAFLYLQQYAAVEAAHRDFLVAAITSLGATPVPANPKGYSVAPFAGTDLYSITKLIRTVEETGVTAYLGSAGFLTDANLVQIASSIYTTEARHSAGVNYTLGLPTGPTGDVGGAQPAADVAANEFEFAQTPSAVLASVKQFFIM